ncbi:uncharacterized protein TNCV_2233291 [Trichonephila clavipes]|nr:uncharacterized protein TNCV_2233291 [Trichonephila clavipes]
MALAAAETIFNNGLPDVPVAINGTWLKISYRFLNGVVTAVSLDTGKVVDAKILSQKCLCNFNSDVHSNECSANYIENCKGMEVEETFRSVVPTRISRQSSRHCWRSPLPHASALVQRNFGSVLGVQQTKLLPHVAKLDLVWQLGV